MIEKTTVMMAQSIAMKLSQQGIDNKCLEFKMKDKEVDVLKAHGELKILQAAHRVLEKTFKILIEKSKGG